MKLKSQHRRMARALFYGAFEDGLLNSARLQENVQRLIGQKIRQKEKVLAALLKKVRIYQRENRLRVLCADELDGAAREKVLSVVGDTSRFVGGVEFVRDRSIMAGIRIEKGYDILESSIAKNLDRLGKNLTAS